VLAAADITVLATVLREGVTNLLRHSKAKHCVVAIRVDGDQASIEVVNDGPQAKRTPGEREPCSGDGLHNLSVRAAEIGGAVSVARGPDEFRLRAEVPMRGTHRGSQRERAEAFRSQPAGLAGDADRVDPVACGQLADDRGQVVPDGADRQEQP
jgi:two-component system sensor histidine kinase DesK